MPGPQFPLAFMGYKMRRMYFFVPPTGTIGIWTTIFSLDGTIAVALSSDGTLMSQTEAQRITSQYFREELEAMEEAFCGAGGEE